MTAIIKPKITDAGLAAAINAKANGFQLAITHIALGTGTYDSETSGAALTSMVSRKEQATVGAGVVSGTGGCRIMVRFGPWEGTPSTYNATELAFYAGDPAAGGILFAVFSTTSGIIVTRNLIDYISTFTLQLTRIPSGSVTVTVDPTATQALALIALHEGATDPHAQYVKKIGDVSTGAQRGLTASTNDNSDKFATTAFVKRSGVTYPDSGGIGIVDTPVNLVAADLGRWVDLGVNNGVVNLPLAASCPVGGAFTFRVPVANAIIVAAAGDTIFMPTGEALGSISLARGETICLSRNATNNWYVTSAGSRMPAGMTAYFSGNNAPPGWLKINGVLLSRTAYPALWAYAQSTGGVVSEDDWLNNGYSGRYSLGTDGTNFRIPDIRGVFLRSSDDGRGMDDVSRPWGTYRADQNRQHNHVANTDSQGSHVHVGIAQAAGAHKHDSGWGEQSPSSRFGTTDSNHNKLGSGTSDFDNFGFWTSTEPDHTHSVVVDASGVHSHSVTVQNEGSQAQPRNVAWGLFLKY